MTIKYKTTKIHWNYYLAIQQDFEVISRFVEFSEKNNKTFSIELARIIMSSSQETDVIMKALCNLLDDTKVPKNINDYRSIIKDNRPDLINEIVKIPRFGMSSTPWENWGKDKNPLWWAANNNIKHQRTDHFEDANLKNAFNSIGGLLISILYYYKLKFEKDSGEEISWKKLTSELKAGESFIMLNDEYYYDNLVI